MESHTVCSLCNECINSDSRGTLVVREQKKANAKDFYACRKCVLATAFDYLNLHSPQQK